MAPRWRKPVLVVCVALGAALLALALIGEASYAHFLYSWGWR